jgi:serine O-acetyltransferase
MDAFQPEPDPARLWSAMREEALALAVLEPCLAKSLHHNVSDHDCLDEALAHRIAHKLGCADVPTRTLRQACLAVMQADPGIAEGAWSDLLAVSHRDPACTTLLTPLLHYSGFLALQAHRVAHGLWRARRCHMALHLQSRCSQTLGVDIHPAARMGRSLMLDHAIGVVIGETAVVEDDVSMLHGVTLGARRSASGDRHPKVRRGAWLGAGVQVLGNIELGAYCRVGAGSVVLEPVPPFCTVAGVPARIVNRPRQADAEMQVASAL